ncbi:MucB/RseB C-terminal domain-containing protein [Glaciecola sp. 2405UD65-10]|uniref:MucB/RseB C-terminal domain-containing protein n=1 Tax=Glaciecola sp. 2405UD65-10 TaxID=3397244 RepID=UPI003B5C7DF9
MQNIKCDTQALRILTLALVLFLGCFKAQASYLVLEQTANDETQRQGVASAEPELALPDPLAGFDETSAYAWMLRLAKAVNEQSYEISYVVSEDSRETLPYLWRHAILENGDEAEQLSLLNGPGFERIRVNTKLSMFEPGYTPYSVRSAHIDGPIPLAFLNSPNILLDSYETLLMGRDRVSGRMAQQIRVVSKDKTRYGYYLWLDEQTGLLLKLNMYSTENRLLKQIQVTELNVNDDVKLYFSNLQKDQLPPISVPNAETQTDFSWTVSYLPEGMVPVKTKLHRLATTGEPAEYMMLSDGLIDVSVYVMNDNNVIQDDLSISSNATSFVSISNGQVQVTVVGDIPVSTANKIADSIVLIGNPK